MSVAAVIPSLPERSSMLRYAIDSVLDQTHPVSAISVAVDHHREGPAVTRNRAAQTGAEFLAFLDDDDVWFPDHIQALLDASHGADVVYTDCRIAGPHQMTCNIDYDPVLLEQFNYIPVTTLVRREAFMDSGMFDPADRFEDWGLWRRLTAAGATFRHVPVTTWEYRFHGGAQRTFQAA